ncbi:MAG TPA: alpha-L-fucosidase [Candidatus Eisenbacteria bacterium]|nr:alpha-L-fucosidase [Candidatus Eisenbacteria bacterium]
MSAESATRDPTAAWFRGARLGLFVHWGHGSQRGWELSWPLVGGVKNLHHCQDVPAEAYHANALTFAPRPGAARAWLAHAKRCGMRYAVLTTKHHDGFALWPTRTADFSIARTPYGGDLVREFADATREAGLKVGFYFSLCDWHHPDYPAFTDADRPYRFGMAPRPTDAQWRRFSGVLEGQIRELLTQYGRVDLLWFDGGWERSADAWRAHELVATIRELQPGIVINDRLPGCGDYDTPEQLVPADPPGRTWETCLTMNESWAWNPDDTEYKSSRALVHTLCEIAGKGGNLLLNVGPRGDGSLAPEQDERLQAIGRWMQDYGEAILDTGAGLAPWQFYGPSTRRGTRIYLHLLSRPYDTVTVRGLPIRRVRAATELRTGTALDFTTRCAIIDELFNPDPSGEVTIRVPEAMLDPLATVLALDVE